MTDFVNNPFASPQANPCHGRPHDFDLELEWFRLTQTLNSNRNRWFAANLISIMFLVFPAYWFCAWVQTEIQGYYYIKGTVAAALVLVLIIVGIFWFVFRYIILASIEARRVHTFIKTYEVSEQELQELTSPSTSR